MEKSEEPGMQEMLVCLHVGTLRVEGGDKLKQKPEEKLREQMPLCFSSLSPSWLSGQGWLSLLVRPQKRRR